jgi:hypothetical protein
MNNLQLYEHSRYSNNRNKKQSLVLDILGSTELGAGSEFNIELFEPLTISKHSELYLDNFVTFNSMLADKPERSSFCLTLNEFNVGTNCASSDDTAKQSIFNSIIIPNENRNSGNFFTSVSHKAKKYNYICDVNPARITNITGKITSLDNKPMFHGDVTTNTKTYALTGINTWTDSSGTAQSLTEGQLITSITSDSGGVAASSNVRILCNTEYGASTIFFTTDSSIVTSQFSSRVITIVVPETLIADENPVRPAYTFTVGTVGSGVQLLEADGRMVAEFSIVSRE